MIINGCNATNAGRGDRYQARRLPACCDVREGRRQTELCEVNRIRKKEGTTARKVESRDEKRGEMPKSQERRVETNLRVETRLCAVQIYRGGTPEVLPGSFYVGNQ